MKKTLTLFAALFLIAAGSNTFAQSARIATTVTTEKHDPAFSLGRDFWFAPGQNYLDESGKYIRIYITSPNNTMAYVESQGITKGVPVPSYGIGIFNAPLEWEMKSSGVAENKAIHVWDPTDDICVNLMSHNPYSSDGMYCIPTIGWGTDYVVASYESLFEGFGSYDDIPCEFTISADQDNTIIEITPSTDLRKSSAYPNGANTVGHPRWKKFEDNLKRGQSVQFQAVEAQDAVNFDVTGTIIHSNNPVGVVGASMCPNIPMAFPYCDFVMDMIPPVRTWGETYYTATTVQPANMPLHDSSMYLMIASKNNQTIHRQDYSTGSHTECVIDSQYHIFWAEAAHANKWYSDAPFLLVQYINSSSYPDGVNGNGDPAEVVIPAKENFSKTAFLNSPTGAGAQAPYDNYANVIVNVRDKNNVTYDGKRITSYIGQPIDSIYEIYVIPHIAPGAHPIESDSGVGVYMYGYGYDETYAWGGSSGVATFNSPDNAPPVATVTAQCFQANVHLADTGALASKISEILLDTDVNMAYQPDVYPNWIEGAGFDTSGYSMYVVDKSKPAILKVSVFDFGGNRTSITSTYTPAIAEIAPYLQDFGSASTSGPPLVIYDTLINNGELPIEISNLSLEYGNAGFTIDSIGGSSRVLPGERRLIPIAFLPIKKTAAIDTIIYNDGCFRYAAGLIGSGGGADFYVTDANWGNVLYPPFQAGKWIAKGAVIHNLSKQDTLAVDTAGWTDRVHFVLLPKQHFPIRVSPIGTAGDTASVWFYFEPTGLGRDTAIASWTSPQVRNADSSLAIRFDRLIGNGVAPLLKFTGDTIVTLNCPSSADTTVQLYFLFKNSGEGPGVIQKVTVSNPTDFINLTGHEWFGPTWDPTRQVENIDPGNVDTFTVDYNFHPNTNSSATTYITVFGISGDTLGAGSLSGTVNVIYPGDSISTEALYFGNLKWMSAEVTKSFTIINTSSTNLAVGSLSLVPGWSHGTYSFTTIPPLPDTLLPGQTITVNVTINPSVLDSIEQAFLEINTNSCNQYQQVTLDALVTNSGSGVAEEIAPPSTASIIQLDDGRSIQVIIPSEWTQPLRLDIYNILGEKVYSTSFAGTSTFDFSALARGVYFYRLREGEISQTGKILLGQ